MSDKIRAYAVDHYVHPARREGRRRFAIPVREVLNSLAEREGLPRQNVPQVCQALRSPRKFLDPLGLEIEKVEGPPSQTGPTVVFHYQLRSEHPESRAISPTETESHDETARSAFKSLRGLLREELAAFGGGEAFLKWLRTDPEKDNR